MVLDGDWKLQSSEAQHKVWLYDLATDPTERRELSKAQPDRTRAMLALLAAQDAPEREAHVAVAAAGPGFIDHPGGVPQKKARNTSSGTTETCDAQHELLPPSTNDQYTAPVARPPVPGAWPPC